MTGWKMSRRWGDLEAKQSLLHDVFAVQEFNFKPLEDTQRQGLERSRSVLHGLWSCCGGDSHPLSAPDRLVEETVEVSEPEAIAQLDEATQAGRLSADLALPLASGGLQALRKGSALVRRQTLEGHVAYGFQHAVDQVQRSVHLALFVSGWIQDRRDFREPWLEAAEAFFPKSGQLCLQWETQELLDVSGVFGQMITQEIASSTAVRLLVKP